jgi:hypothetical protein
LSEGQLDYLRREAAKRRRSLSSYITDCLLDYHVEAAPVRRTSTESSPPFSALLRDTEERISAEIEKRTSGASTQLSKQLMVLTAMFDRFVLSNLVSLRAQQFGSHARSARGQSIGRHLER